MPIARVLAPMTGYVDRRNGCGNLGHKSCDSGCSGSPSRTLLDMSSSYNNVHLIVELTNIKSVIATVENCCCYAAPVNVKVKLYYEINYIGYVGYIKFGHLKDAYAFSNPNITNQYVGMVGTLQTNGERVSCWGGKHLHTESSSNGTPVWCGPISLYGSFYDFSFNIAN
jgi:hypothetical protein